VVLLRKSIPQNHNLKAAAELNVIPHKGTPTMLKAIPDMYRAATPYIIVNDASRAIDFYRASFDATEVVRLADPSGKIMHAEIRIGNTALMLADEFPDMGYRSPKSLGGSPVSLLLYVADVDAFFAKAVAGGATETMAVADQFDGDRRGTLTDPFGHVWLLATKQEDVSYEEMQIRFARMMTQSET
jgi:PhnB protein